MNLTGLPDRVVVDQHGHFWQDFGDYWSMCRVSDENVETEAVAIYRLVSESLALDHFLSEAKGGQWRAERSVGLCSELWLINDSGDSLLVTAEDAALLVNAALAIATEHRR